MTNNDIIAGTVLQTVGKEAVLNLAATVYTPAQLAARRASIRVQLPEGSAMTQAEAEEAAFCESLAVTLFHTFQGWKETGRSVKKGEHAAVVAWLWKPKKPSKAEQEAENMMGGPSLMGPDFVKCKAFLFSAAQVEKIKS